MMLRLVLENAPRPQGFTEIPYSGGQVVIGRSDEADWRLDDPDMFVSRRHAILSEEDGAVMVTDASSGGLFVDNAANPLGAGNSVPLEQGMRLRLGDFVFRVETSTEVPATEATGKKEDPFAFGSAEPIPETPRRPETLPDPFGMRREDRSQVRSAPPATPRPFGQEDPFGLDLSRAFEGSKPEQDVPPASGRRGGYFDTPAPQPAREATPAPESTPVRFDPPAAAENPVSAVPPPEPPSVSAGGAESEVLRAALFRGLGLQADRFEAEDFEAEMEAVGARLRELVDGLMLLLRTRAQEKQKVRVAQTLISSADVNPLKFLASTDEALAALLRPRGAGYLPPDRAVAEAYGDLVDHQLRTWTALQTALRRMIDKFDPEEIERELAETGLLEKLIAGGRSAKMWQLYQERYREIARAAEEQFLGEVGHDFREAYENNRRN
ncbi:type VI secretion system-associated FHA domain protein TagH [Ruegeria marina]|uniref:FHA domain protein n=1 Tax=Ruegeria marina TaxID=639004 RepID=A0A1G7CWL2_9RHOB|nr:type VI secretion system-associated FHA domain protein TagH [Ruegeria marina]SDE43844.1 FHA domain protein [Ruegeria marina]